MNAVNRRRAIKFLKSKGILEEFIERYNRKRNSKKYPLKVFLVTIGKLTFIESSFYWGSTKEGFRYWWEIEKEWLEYLREKGEPTIWERISSIFY